MGNGSNYTQAYFEIASIHVFSEQNLLASSLISDSRGLEILMLSLGLGWITAAFLLMV